MKKFTFILTFLLTGLISSGQNSTVLQQRVETAKEKYARFISLRQPFTGNHTSFVSTWSLPLETTLKSTAALMRLDSILSTTWDIESGGWKNDTKDEYFYDSEMKNTMWQNSEWNTETDAWEIWSKTEVEYNSNGSVEKMNIYESYEPGTAPTLMNTVYIFYNEAGQLDSVQHWYADGPDT
jgi:hypothetical protein